MSGYPLSPIQSAYCRISEAADAAVDPIFRSGLLQALEILKANDPDVDVGMEPPIPGACYGPVT